MKQLLNMIGNSFMVNDNDHALGIIINDYKQSKQAIKKYDKKHTDIKPVFIVNENQFHKAVNQLKLNKAQTILKAKQQ